MDDPRPVNHMILSMLQDDTTGRKILLIGLHQENIDRLKNDEPIHKPLDDPNEQGSILDGWDLMIIGPEDLERFVAQNQKAIRNAQGGDAQ